VDDLVEHSRAVIERGSKSFAAAARLFDPQTRAGAYLLYAWCRHCDDRTDDQELGFDGGRLAPSEARARLAELEEQTRSALRGETTADPVFAGLAAVVRRHEIPERHPLEHLAGFRMDVEGRTYRTLDDTLEYCYHVAGVVGVMMAHIMGVRDEPTLDRAADLGIAFQLTNICRDAVEDARNGRVYLPAELLAAAGVPTDALAAPEQRDGLAAVVRRILAEADRYYASARLGISRLPFRSAWAVAAARAVYRDIGRLLLDRGAGAWNTRAATGRGRKLALVLLAGGAAAAATRLGKGRESAPRDGLWTRPAAPSFEKAARAD
jgi:15-cis-phytoene synthase